MEKPLANSPAFTPHTKATIAPTIPLQMETKPWTDFKPVVPLVYMRWAYLQLAAKQWWHHSDGWQSPIRHTLITPHICLEPRYLPRRLICQGKHEILEIRVLFNGEGVGRGLERCLCKFKACAALPEDPNLDSLSGSLQPLVTPAPDDLAPSLVPVETCAPMHLPHPTLYKYNLKQNLKIIMNIQSHGKNIYIFQIFGMEGGNLQTKD